jgi:hypothetical protein
VLFSHEAVLLLGKTNVRTVNLTRVASLADLGSRFCSELRCTEYEVFATSTVNYPLRLPSHKSLCIFLVFNIPFGKIFFYG